MKNIKLAIVSAAFIASLGFVSVSWNGASHDFASTSVSFAKPAMAKVLLRKIP